MKPRRVVVTGMGVVAPNAHGLDNYAKALRDGVSGIRFYPELRELKFRCQVGGIPQNIDAIKHDYFAEEALFAMSHNMLFAGIAAIDAWRDARMDPPDSEKPDMDTGAIIGTGIGSADGLADRVGPKVRAGRVRRMGSTMVEQVMGSAPSASTAGLLGLGNQVTSNSSACSTGTEAVIMAYDRIRFGNAERMLAGGSEEGSWCGWGCFDAMQVLNPRSNDAPEQASRPMSRSAGGFIPSAGAGVLLVESLDSAEKRGARIYAEILAGTINCGGHRQGGSMTAPNPYAVEDCVRRSVAAAGITPSEIDAINGHLTATYADPHEVHSWSRALELGPGELPWINATKSLIGHGLGAAGGLECVAVVLQLHHGFVHGSANCEDVHEEIVAFSSSIPHRTVEPDSLNTIIKASFGFGDVNSCIIFKRWNG